MGNKRKLGRKEDEFEFDPVPKHLVVAHLRNQEKRLIIILEKAQLESVKVGNSFQLLNCDDHVGMLKKYNRDPGSCRPDITHQCLLMLMDSPLNRAGLLQVYVHTEKNVLIEINPQTRIPRTFKRFAGLMANLCLYYPRVSDWKQYLGVHQLKPVQVQLLHRFSVRSSENSTKLLKVIRNPVTDHLPVGCRKIGTSFSASNVVNPRELVPADDPVTFLVGAVAHGKVSPDYIEDTVSISNYPLSAALTCTKLCSAFEEVWGVM